MSKPAKPDAPKAVRTTVSLNPRVNQWAAELMKEGGYNSFSDLIEDLVRRKMEEKEKLAHERALATRSANFPEHREQFATIEERATANTEKQVKLNPEEKQ